MSTKSRRPKDRDTALTSLNGAIDAMNLAKDAVGVTPAKVVFGSVVVVLTMIRVRFSCYTMIGLDFTGI